MKRRNVKWLLLSSLCIVLFAGCSNEESSTPKQKESPHSEMDHAHMDHSSSGELPEGLQVAENPKYPVGSNVTITNGHMTGMEGAKGEVVGAYDTTVYAISYDPTNGGERVTNHKWIVHEEVKNPPNKPLEQGAEVVVEADHMKGMKSATATIDFAEKITVYMVNYTSTTGEKVRNHKWMVESELAPVE